MKLHKLTIENFRGFDRFAINHLGRVNLLVGTNNSGKTSILEATYLLMSSRPAASIWNILSRRGEVLPGRGKAQASVPTELVGDVRLLFGGRTFAPGRSLQLSGATDAGLAETRIRIDDGGMGDATIGAGIGPVSSSLGGAGFASQAALATPIASLVITSATSPDAMGVVAPSDEVLGLDQDGCLAAGAARQAPFLSRGYKPLQMPHFVDTNSLINSQYIARHYAEIALTSEEELVLEAVRLISPEVQRIASIGTTIEWPGLPARDGIYARLEGVAERVPLGSLGDGIWRMLGLALAVVHSRDKILLIDEIDTGLHHSIMGKMWRFLDECSKRFNVQIIATTHSRDCYQSLAEICREDVIDQSEVTIQRIERGRSESVAYSEAEIIAAADRDIEVR